MYLRRVADTIVVIQVFPLEQPSELDIRLEPLTIDQVEDDQFLIQFLRNNMQPSDLQHLPAVCLVTENLGEKIQEARKLTKGAFGVLLPIPANIFVEVTLFSEGPPVNNFVFFRTAIP